MQSMIDFYQKIPEYISPIAFSVGPLSVHWYSLMWIVAFVVGYVLLMYRVKKGEGKYGVDFIQDIVANALIGALIGGRLGYVFFYDFLYYVAHPLQIVSPYDFALGEWVGIYGMSYHGGLIGVIVALVWSARKNGKDILRLFDFVAPVVPIGYTFGRIGNFMNEELVGRVTTSSFGMYFNDENILRHPSQLYEGFLEGLMLFIVLWSVRNKKFKRGTLSAFYLIGYALARFIVEYFREPDEHLGFVVGQMTMGQVLSGIMIVAGVGMLVSLYKSNLLRYFTPNSKM